MIKLTQVELNNFLSFHHAILPLDNQGITLITGENSLAEGLDSNGSGKSSLIGSITYALYGKTINGLKSDDIINRNFAKGTSVKLDFVDTESNTKYRIERYRKDKTNHNRVLLYANGEEITEATTAKTDQHIQQVIGTDYETYITGIHVGKSDTVPLFADASDSQKKDILENIAKLSIYDKAHEIALNKYKELDTKSQVLQAKINSSTHTIEQLSDKQQETEDKSKEINQKLQESLSNKELLNKNLSNFKVDYSRQIAEENAQQVVWQRSIDSYKQYQQDYQNVSSDISKVSNDISQINYQVSDLQSKLVELRNQYSESSYQKTCPWCGAILDEAHRKQEIDRITKQGVQIKKDYLDKVNSLGPLEDKKKDLELKFNKVKDSLSGYGELSSNIQKSIKRVQQLNNDLQSRERQVEDEQRKHDNLLIQLNSLVNWEDEIKKYQESLIKMVKDHKELDKDIEEYSLVAKKIFSNSGIRSYVLQAITPFLDAQANKYLSQLTGETMTMHLSTQSTNKSGDIKEKFDISLFDMKGENLMYKNASTGERKRVDLAISFAIRDLIAKQSQSNFNIAIYDECFDGLDSIGMEYVMEMLHTNYDTLDSVFVVSHNDALKSSFDNVITVSKDVEGNSTIK